MRHHSIATPRHMWQYSLQDLRKFLSNNNEFLDDILNRTAEALSIIIAAGCIYKIIQLIYTSNVTYQVYAGALQNLITMHHIYTTALQGFL